MRSSSFFMLIGLPFLLTPRLGSSPERTLAVISTRKTLRAKLAVDVRAQTFGGNLGDQG